LKRNDIDFVIFERNKTGGSSANANLIENYPGFPKGITGDKFTGLLEKHLVNWRIEPIFAEVTAADFDGNGFVVTTSIGIFLADYLIVAAGTVPLKDTSLSIGKDAIDKVFYEIAGTKLDNKQQAAIIGGGDAAFDYALNLSARGIRTEIFIRGNSPKSLPLLIKRAENDSNISLGTNMKLRAVNGSEQLNLEFLHKNKPIYVKTDCMFFAIGREPATGFLSERLRGLLSALQNENKLFLTGDIKNTLYRQAAIAAGDGLLAAMKIVHSIEEQNESNRKNK
jgi:thioredoxin reductase